MSTKLTKKEKRKTKRIEKKLTTKICIEVNSFGDCICPHCGYVFLTVLDEDDKMKVSDICDSCGGRVIFTEDIVKDIVNRTKRIQQLLEKVKSIEYGDIDVIEAGIDKNCDINEVALLCKYFQCGLAKLSSHVKRLIPKEAIVK